MIYIIISNVGLALMTLILYFRYSHFRITSTFKIRDLEKRLNHEVTEKESLTTNLRSELKGEIERVKQLLITIDNLRREKEEEARLRLEAEKQIEIAMQKTQAIERRMDDWKIAQDAAMEDAKRAIFKVGGDLFEKLTKTHKEETTEHRGVIEQTVKSVYGYLDNISKNVESFKQTTDLVSEKLDKAVVAAASGAMMPDVLAKSSGASATSSNIGSGAASSAAPANSAAAQLDPETKKIIAKVIENIKLSGYEANKKYFAATTLSAEKAKILLCDLAFLKEEGILYVFDFKAIRYLQEYTKTKASNKSAAEILKQRLTKYIAYISNPKYAAAVQKIASSLKMQFKTTKIVFVVSMHDDLAVLKEIKLNDQTAKAGVEVLDVDTVNDIVL